MANVPVAGFRIEITTKGGFIEGETVDGHRFDTGRQPYQYIAAVAAVIIGPHPEYDHEHNVFSCSASRSRGSDRTLAMRDRDDE